MKQTVQIFTSFQAVFQSCFIKHQWHCYIITGMEGILNTVCKDTSNNFFAKILCYSSKAYICEFCFTEMLFLVKASAKHLSLRIRLIALEQPGRLECEDC